MATKKNRATEDKGKAICEETEEEKTNIKRPRIEKLGEKSGEK
ncbi:hypothetical protein CASFOL_000484 [Castilleja foliolosa]|uniref:Uncharacterized protein n=1 Tax=Castilleja foliolosa TaxID=1961234 RepID=A0ABD3EP18_9LAMI